MKLTLYFPVKPVILSQNFNEDFSCYNPDLNRVITRTGATCPVGYRSIYKPQMLGHNGLDLVAKSWQPVYAANEGRVDEIQTEPARGLGIGIVSSLVYDFVSSPFNVAGSYFAKTRYWHLAGFNVKLGDQVKAGDLIGWADNTGYSSGDHLHFELKPVNKFGSNVFQTNGFFGAIDPFPYFDITETAFDKNSFITRIKLQIADLMSQLQGVLTKVVPK